MRVFFPLVFAAVTILILGLVELAMLRFLNRDWWRIKVIRVVAIVLPGFCTLAVIGWGLGEYYQLKMLAGVSGAAAFFGVILLLCLMLSLPAAGFVHFIRWLSDRCFSRHLPQMAEETNHKRRLFLKTVAATLPAAALGLGTTGVGRAMGAVNVYLLPIAFDNLPPALEGLKILHLSDLHLRPFSTFAIDEVLSQAAEYEPDLVVVTGDVADDLTLLPRTLDALAEFGAPLGAYTCLGNHEYFRGVPQVRRIHDGSRVPLLVNETVRLDVNKHRLLLTGIDDPRYLRVSDESFFGRCLDASGIIKADNDFVLVLSHRPEALYAARERGFDLVLAGHTHGGQVGFMGRSVFESYWPDRFLWGHYYRGRTHLYTSAGAGHWFPFRLGCPPEAPVIELRQA